MELEPEECCAEEEDPPLPPGTLRRWSKQILLWNGLTLVSTWVEVFVPLPRVLGFPFTMVSCIGGLLLLAALVAVPGAIAAVLLALVSSDVRRLLRLILSLAGVLFVVTLPTYLAADSLWDAGFRHLADRSLPLVEAIRKYEDDKGYPPEKLDDLVRESYLKKIPSTPCGCSDYRYERDVRNNPWTLTVTPPFRGIGFDLFEYWPRQNYPEHAPGGHYERVGDWAYFHE